MRREPWAWRSAGLALAAGLGLAAPAQAACDVAPPQRAALHLQIAHWLDLAEHGLAVALSRELVRRCPDDLESHRWRVRALERAGMRVWAEAEAGRPGAPREASLALAIEAVLSGEGLRLPDGAPDAARAEVAYRRGDLGAVRAWLVDADGPDARRMALRLAVDADDPVAVRREVDAWPEAAPLAGLAELAKLPEKGRKAGLRRRVRAAVGERLDARVAQAGSPDALLDAGVLAVALDRREALEAIQGALDARSGVGPDGPDLQRLSRELVEPPQDWDLWQVPRRKRWNEAMLDAAARAVSGRDRPELWARADEGRIFGRALVERLEKQGRVEAADRVRQRWMGPCVGRRMPEILAVTDRPREAREMAEDDLLRCLGGTDPVPALDPAGLDVEARFDDAAGAWRRFGSIADLGGWFDDAALAWGLAAWLHPDPIAVAKAQERARAVGWAVDPALGLPSRETLVAAAREAAWLRPASAVGATRGRRALAQLVALLEPTPENLAAAAPLERTCLPTQWSACTLDWAVARLAAERAGARVDVPDPRDAGAEAAAGAWLAALQSAWFARRAELSALAGGASRLDLTGVLAAEGPVRVGRPAPRWRIGGVRSEDLRGSVVVLTWWASWCAPCFAELPVLDGHAGRWAQEGLPVRVIAVNVDDTEERFRRALPRLDLAHVDVARDPALRRTFDVDALPTTVLIDAEGVLREVTVGYEGGLAPLDEAVRTWTRMASRR